METVKNKSISKPVILLKILKDDSLVAVDNYTTIRFFNKETLELKNGFKANIHHKYYANSVVAFSDNGKYFATLSADARESLLYNAQTKKRVAKVDRHQGESSCVGIDPLSRYMFSCGDDGKTFAIDIKSGKLVFTLPAHADTITDIAFSKNANWVAVSSYDRKISLYNLVTMTPTNKLRAHSAPVMKLLFFNKRFLLSIDKRSSAIIWDVYEEKVVERLQGIHDDVTQVTMSGDEKFLFIATKLGYILLYDLNTYELLSGKYIKIVSPITSLTFDNENNYLVIGTQDGFIMYYDIYEGKDQLKILLQKKDFDAIQKASTFNPVLAYTDIHNLVSNFWENSLQKAKLFLQKGENEKAKLLLKNFESIPTKNKVIQKLFRDYAEYEKFVRFAKEGKISLAYNLANSFPVYKESKLYQALEKKWKKDFTQAQKYSLDPKGMDTAKQILAPYRGISDKTVLIQDLFTKGEVYKRFRDAFGKKNFRIASELIRQYPFLKEFPEYDILIKYGDNLYMKARELIEKEDYYHAIKTLRILSDFLDFKDEVHLMLTEIEQKQKFFEALEKEDFAKAYSLLDKIEALQETSEGQKLQDKWNTTLEHAKSFAVAGDVEGLKNALKDYLKIPSKYMAIATLFAWCYISQLEKAVAKGVEQKKIENGIKQYLLNFGYDEQIEGFLRKAKKKYRDMKLTLELLPKGSLSMWRPSMIVDSILET